MSAGPENSTTCVIEMDGAAVGRLRLVVAPDRIEIAGIQVLPARQGHGIGTAVIRNVLDRAEHERVPVVIDVENDNPGARRLYERLGFTAGAAVTSDRRPLSHDPRPSTLPMTAAGWRTPESRATAERWAEYELDQLGQPPVGPMTDVSIQPWSAV